MGCYYSKNKLKGISINLQKNNKLDEAPSPHNLSITQKQKHFPEKKINIDIDFLKTPNNSIEMKISFEMPIKSQIIEFGLLNSTQSVLNFFLKEHLLYCEFIPTKDYIEETKIERHLRVKSNKENNPEGKQINPRIRNKTRIHQN